MCETTVPRVEIVEVDPAKVHPPDGNRKVTPESVSDILPSIEKDKQLVPGIIFPHPTLPGEWMAADGNRRAMVARILGRPFIAYVLPAAPTEEELIRIRVTANFHRRNATAYELAVDIEKWMALKNANQKQAAAFFGISEGQVSKTLNKARNAVPEVVQAEKDGRIVEDVGRLLATQPKDRQVVALKHVIDSRMTRDEVEGWLATLKARTPKAPPPVEVKDGDATIKLPASWTLQRVLELATRLMDAAKRGMKAEGVTVQALPGLLRP